MITAREAQTNVINYENTIKADVQNKVNELIEIMSKSIAYHSKNGFDTLSFCPYEKSRFSSVKTLEYAQDHQMVRKNPRLRLRIFPITILDVQHLKRSCISSLNLI